MKPSAGPQHDREVIPETATRRPSHLPQHAGVGQRKFSYANSQATSSVSQRPPPKRVFQVTSGREAISVNPTPATMSYLADLKRWNNVRVFDNPEGRPFRPVLFLLSPSIYMAANLSFLSRSVVDSTLSEMIVQCTPHPAHQFL